MSNVQPCIEGGGLVRDARHSGRTISRYQAASQVRVAKVDTDTDIALAKVDTITTTTGTASDVEL